LRWALRSARRGEADSKTIIIIVLAVVGGLMLLVCGGAAVLVILPGIQSARTAARSTQSKNNLHSIGIALHNYHDVYQQFPPGRIVGEDDTEYIGWQTSILPYVDQAPLFESIDTNVPWTDPANRPYFQTVISVYINPNVPESPVGPQGLAMSHYAGNSQVFSPNGTMRMASFTDGMSNTILAGEVAAGFKPWGDPDNLRDPAAGIRVSPSTFSGPTPALGTQFLLGDGMVRSISSDVDPALLEALATPAGGERVDQF
jgi:hypothetical protein